MLSALGVLTKPTGDGGTIREISLSDREWILH